MNGKVTKQKCKRSKSIRIFYLALCNLGYIFNQRFVANIVQDPEILVYRHIGHNIDNLFAITVYEGTTMTL